MFDNTTEKTTARTLGFVSLGIGLSEILFPKQIEKTMEIGRASCRERV